MFWNVSDYLQNRGQSFLVGAKETLEGDESHLLAQAKSEKETVSNAALWMLLLLRLTSVTTDRRVELRNSTFHGNSAPLTY